MPKEKVIKTVRISELSAERAASFHVGDDKGGNGKSSGAKLSERAASFHQNQSPGTKPQLRRPKTETDLLPRRNKMAAVPSPESVPKLTKLLLNVTIENSLVAVHVVIAPESTVGDLIAAAVKQYEKEGRRPLLSTKDAGRFDLHYSQFSLESLDRDTKLGNLGSRNFFLCCSKNDNNSGSSSSCSNQAETKGGFPWLRIKEFFA